MGEQERGWNRAARPLAAVLLAAIAVRAAYLAVFVGSPLFGVHRIDQLYYRTWALRIAGGEWVGPGVFEQGPLYAYLCGLLFRLAGSGELLPLAAQCAAGVLTAWLVFTAGRRLFDAKTALAAGLLCALYGPLIFYECMLMKTWLEPLLVVAALAAGLRAGTSGGLRWHALAGFAVGLACLVREIHALLIAPLLLGAAAGSPGRGARRLLAPAAVATSFAVALAPAALHNRLAGGEFVGVSAAGGENLYIAFGPYATGFYAIPDFLQPFPFLEHRDFREEAFLRTGRPHSRAESSRYWLAEAWRAVREDPLRALGLAAAKLAIAANDFEVPDSESFSVTSGFVPLLGRLPTFGWIFGVGAFGLALLARKPPRFGLLLGFAAALFVEILLTFNLGRYRAALAAFWTLPAARGLTWIWAAAREPGASRGRALAAALACAALSAAAFRTPPGLDRERREREESLLRAEVSESARIRDALPGLERAAERSPTDPEGRFVLGYALQRTGKWPEADQAYGWALRLDPAHAGALLRRAELLLRQDRIAAAEVLARQLLSRNPEHAGGLALLGRLRAHAGADAPDRERALPALAQARSLLREALSRNAELVEARVTLARVLLLEGETAAAVAELQDALRRDPDSREAAHLLLAAGERLRPGGREGAGRRLEVPPPRAGGG